MRIITEEPLKNFVRKHSDAEVAVQDWIKVVKKSNWKCFADIKNTFNSVDSIGGQRYIFNIKGSSYRIVVVIRFTIQYVYIRFIGTHHEYDEIDCRTI